MPLVSKTASQHNPSNGCFGRKHSTGISIALALMLSGCHASPTSKVDQTTALKATASEIFELRTKCARFGAKKLEEDIHGYAVNVEEVTNYNPNTNRCYIKLESSPADLSRPMDQYYHDQYVYDGQTGELLVTSTYKNLPGWEGPGDDKHESKSGNIFYDHKCTAEPCSGYEGAEKEIELLMHDDRQQ